VDGHSILLLTIGLTLLSGMHIQGVRMDKLTGPIAQSSMFEMSRSLWKDVEFLEVEVVYNRSEHYYEACDRLEEYRGRISSMAIGSVDSASA
jgi:hypothetical protein